ncbi:MAG: TonB-dependent receptor [Pseudomonadota bacterium]
MLVRRKTCAAAGCLLVPFVLFPGIAQTAEEATRLGTVTVTGTAVEEENSYQLDAEEVPGIAPDAASLLHKVPGANVNRNGALTGIAQYRGLYGDRVNVRINGITVQEGCTNSMDPPLSFISGTQLEGLEVIRGIAPVSSGLETLGGTMHARSIRPAFGGGDDMEARGSLRLSGATVNDAGAAGVLAGVTNRTHRFYLSGSRERGDDIEFDGGTIRPSRHERDSYGLGYGYRRDGHAADVDVAHLDTGPTGTPSLPMDIEMSDTDTVSTEYSGYLGAHAVHGQLFHSDVHHTMTNFLLRPDPGAANRRLSTSDGTGTGYRLDVGRALGGGKLLVGVDGQLATHDAVITNPANPSFLVVNFNDAERNVYGLFGEWDGAIGAGWRSEFGLRLNHVHTNAGPVSSTMAPMAPLVAAFNSADRSRDDNNLDWVARFNHVLSDSTDFELGFARKTRSPSYQERYLWAPLEATAGLADGKTYLGDIDLDPEVSHQVELALTMAAAGSYLEPRVFYRDVSDYIQGVPPTGAAPYDLKFSNVDATLYGADAAWGYRIDARWRVDGIVSYVRGKRDDVSDNLYRIAPLNGTLGLTYIAPAWEVTAEGVFYERQNKVSAYNDETPSAGYALMNLSGKYRIQQDLTLSGGVGNVFDRRYAPHLAGINRAAGSDVPVGVRVPGEGRNFYLALQLDW